VNWRERRSARVLVDESPGSRGDSVKRMGLTIVVDPGGNPLRIHVVKRVDSRRGREADAGQEPQNPLQRFDRQIIATVLGPAPARHRPVAD
jgi:hypothetical protein